MLLVLKKERERERKKPKSSDNIFLIVRNTNIQLLIYWLIKYGSSNLPMMVGYVSKIVGLSRGDRSRWCRGESGTLEDPVRQSVALSVPRACSTVLSSSATTVRYAHWWTLGGIWSPSLSPPSEFRRCLPPRIFPDPRPLISQSSKPLRKILFGWSFFAVSTSMAKNRRDYCNQIKVRFDPIVVDC